MSKQTHKANANAQEATTPICCEPQYKYPQWLSVSMLLLMYTEYLLCTLLPFILGGFVMGVCCGIISRHVLTVLVALIALDYAVPLSNGYRPPLQRGGNFCRLLEEGGCHYFPARYVCLAKVSKEKTYLLASWPHGLVGKACHFCFLPFLEKGYHPICAGADILLYTPFLRRLCTTIGYCSCSKASLHKALNVKKYGSMYPYNIVHLPVDGIGEMFYTDETIIISKRKGFIKVALETGAHTLPQYTFGANQTYYRPCCGPNSLLANVSSMLRISILPWFGRWWIPMGVIPFRVPVLSVVGPAMELPEDEPITNELVDRLHAEFCQRLRNLFDEYKVVYVHEMGASEEWLSKKLRFEDEE